MVRDEGKTMKKWGKLVGDKLSHFIHNEKSLCGYITDYQGTLHKRPTDTRRVCIVCEKLLEAEEEAVFVGVIEVR